MQEYIKSKVKSAMRVDLKVLDNGKRLDLPQYATSGSAGVDLRAAIKEDYVIAPGDRAVIPTGIVISLPEGHEAQIRSRSGLAAKYGVAVLNAPGTIDSDYRGEIGVILINTGRENFVVERGMRVAQMVISKFETIEWNVVEDLDETKRSVGGYGSTGTK